MSENSHIAAVYNRYSRRECQLESCLFPLRVRARSSSFSNLSVTNPICRGCLIADVPAIVGSIDIVMGEIDR